MPHQHSYDVSGHADLGAEVDIGGRGILELTSKTALAALLELEELERPPRPLLPPQPLLVRTVPPSTPPPREYRSRLSFDSPRWSHYS